MKFALLFIMLSTHAYAWEGQARALLPAKLRSLQLKKTTTEQAIKTLGKPDLKKDSTYYWIEDDFKYTIALTFSSSKLSSLHYNFPKKPSLKSLPWLQEKDLIVQEKVIVAREKDIEIIVNPTSREVESVSLK